MTDQIKKYLIKNRWVGCIKAYGSKKNPDPRDGRFYTLTLGNYKYKEGYIQSNVYDKFMNIGKELVDIRHEVQKIDTDTHVGGRFTVHEDDFENFMTQIKNSSA